MEKALEIDCYFKTDEEDRYCKESKYRGCLIIGENNMVEGIMKRDDLSFFVFGVCYESNKMNLFAYPTAERAAVYNFDVSYQSNDMYDGEMSMIKFYSNSDVVYGTCMIEAKRESFVRSTSNFVKDMIQIEQRGLREVDKDVYDQMNTMKEHITKFPDDNLFIKAGRVGASSKDGRQKVYF